MNVSQSLVCSPPRTFQLTLPVAGGGGNYELAVAQALILLKPVLLVNGGPSATRRTVALADHSNSHTPQKGGGQRGEPFQVLYIFQLTSPSFRGINFVVDRDSSSHRDDIPTRLPVEGR